VAVNASSALPDGTNRRARLASMTSQRTRGSVTNAVGSQKACSPHRARLAPWSTFGWSETVPKGSGRRACPSMYHSLTRRSGSPNQVASM
jgi:hypothetical protein